MFLVIWVQMINQAINLELQFSQDLALSRTIGGIQWIYKMLYFHKKDWDQKKMFWESLESTDDSLAREHWWGLKIFKSIQVPEILIEHLSKTPSSLQGII